ncbi:AraC family transcriptional regulator [Acidisphaera rubrifaciens]|uniref:DNA binding protein with helix-turn-helix domain n=1 Tax=Acidisphaera rubrifaciens HS-AP3 TaxID=1231350 RepID=A0A0D6P5G1_9PROT|nr:AraC family transcriptional regulator [Acidisphaera rubrifaciens]GAN76897.1 DNA binding protein with helix-turn-helix domain [Acidisphaera rubrifaciens HS-AP3]
MAVLVPPDLIPHWIPGEKVVDSAHLGWDGLTLKGYRYPDQESRIPLMRDYMIVIYEGPRATMQRSSGGPWQSGIVERGVISLLTRAEQSVWRWDGPIHVKHIYVTHETIERTANQVFDRAFDRVRIEDRVRAEDTVIPLHLHALERELDGTGLGERLYVDAIRTQLAIHLLRHYADVAFREHRPGAFSPGLRRAIIDYIEANLAQTITLDDLAALAGLSSYHFARRFKAEFGMAPHSHVVARRVERAERLLKDGRMPLKLVAAECGFTDQSHLSRVFRRVRGVTPNAARNGA